MIIELLFSGVLLIHDDRVLGNKNPQTGQDCCGPHACIPITGVRHESSGYRLPNGQLIPEGMVLPSDDGKFWVCSHPTYGVTCFFVPQEVM